MVKSDKLLILDLDETLIYATAEPLIRNHDFMIDRYHVYVRPHVSHFLEACLNLFTVGIWTSATADYAEEAINHIFGNPSRLAFVWSRERCTRRLDTESQEIHFVKNLKKVRQLGFSLDQVVIVDNDPHTFADNYGNGIPIIAFHGAPDDDELPRLLKYLEYLASVENIRKVEKRGWRQRSI
jgi:Dullard-like phosphatase family protein